MALIRKQTLKNFFSAQWLDSSDFFKHIFSRKRFFQLFWGIHISPPNPSSSSGTQSRSAKLRNVLDYVGANFLKYYRPSQNLSADESTVPFKGRVACKMYASNKPVKWGIRVYDVADAATGYILSMIPYYGPELKETLCHPVHSFTTRIIFQLIDNITSVIKESGYHVFTDRLYTSIELAQELFNRKMHLTGTLNTNRKGLPIQFKKGKPKMQQFQVQSLVKASRYHVLVWKDKRYVFMLSTKHDDKVHQHRRFNKRGQEELISKPNMIADYTAHMGGVDRADHYISSYQFLQRSVKWWRKLYFFVLESSVVNSFILFNMHMKNLDDHNATLDHRSFRKELIYQLVAKVRNPTFSRFGHISTIDHEARLDGKLHIIDHRPYSRDCIVCSDRGGPGGRKETVYYCDTCPRKPGLHPKECFRVYHTKQQYKKKVQVID